MAAGAVIEPAEEIGADERADGARGEEKADAVIADTGARRGGSEPVW